MDNKELKPMLLNAAALMLDACIEESNKQQTAYKMKSIDAKSENEKQILFDEYTRWYGNPYKMAAERAKMLWGEICALS